MVLMCFYNSEKGRRRGKAKYVGQKVEKDKGTGAVGKNTRPEPNVVSVAPRVKPELALPVMYFPNPLISHYLAGLICLSSSH